MKWMQSNSPDKWPHACTTMRLHKASILAGPTILRSRKQNGGSWTSSRQRPEPQAFAGNLESSNRQVHERLFFFLRSPQRANLVE